MVSSEWPVASSEWQVVSGEEYYGDTCGAGEASSRTSVQQDKEPPWLSYPRRRVSRVLDNANERRIDPDRTGG